MKKINKLLISSALLVNLFNNTSSATPQTFDHNSQAQDSFSAQKLSQKNIALETIAMLVAQKAKPDIFGMDLFEGINPEATKKIKRALNDYNAIEMIKTVQGLSNEDLKTLMLRGAEIKSSFDIEKAKITNSDIDKLKDEAKKTGEKFIEKINSLNDEEFNKFFASFPKEAGDPEKLSKESVTKKLREDIEKLPKNEELLSNKQLLASTLEDISNAYITIGLIDIYKINSSNEITQQNPSTTELDPATNKKPEELSKENIKSVNVKQNPTEIFDPFVEINKRSQNIEKEISFTAQKDIVLDPLINSVESTILINDNRIDEISSFDNGSEILFNSEEIKINNIEQNTPSQEKGSEVKKSQFSYGSVSRKKGAWVEYSLLKSTKGKKGDIVGYSASLNNATIGFDADLLDNLMLGISLSLQNEKMKINNIIDKTASQKIFSIYGEFDFGNGLKLDGQALYGNNSIVIQEKEQAKKESLLNTVSGKLLVKYQIPINQRLIITPKIGASYSAVLTSKQEGLLDKISYVAGLNLKSFMKISDNLIFIPSAHFDFNYSSKKDLKEENTDFSIEVPANSAMNFGGSASFIINQSQELALSYDYITAKDFKAHKGTVKLRVNF